MKRLLRLATTVVLSVAGLAPAALADGEKIANFTIVDPIQIFDNETSIKGVRFNLIYGVNKELRGLDVGLINRTSGTTKALQWGPLVGIADTDFTGWQANGLANVVNENFTGVQTGIANRAQFGEGFQFGIFNSAEMFSGFQLGFFNITNQLNGLQIGLLNIARAKEKLPIFPIVNWSF